MGQKRLVESRTTLWNRRLAHRLGARAASSARCGDGSTAVSGRAVLALRGAVWHRARCRAVGLGFAAGDAFEAFDHECEFVGCPHTSIARATGLLVLTLAGSDISEITRFADTSVFPLFGLPRSIPTES
jgi:hypothetical protein